MYVINSKKNDSLNDQNPVLYRGDDHIIEEMDGLKFRIGPKSFYQTNTKQALNSTGLQRSLQDLQEKKLFMIFIQEQEQLPIILQDQPKK